LLFLKKEKKQKKKKRMEWLSLLIRRLGRLNLLFPDLEKSPMWIFRVGIDMHTNNQLWQK
jgi:hypothetical protein